MRYLKNISAVCCIVAIAVINGACASFAPRNTPIVRVVKTYAPTVVNIRTEQIVDLREDPSWGEYGVHLDNFFKEYFGEAYSEGKLKYRSLGSGVIASKNGLIVTNAHVVQKASSIFVVLKDGTILEGKVAGISKSDDLALVKTELPYPIAGAKFANIEELMIGETVIAIGNPLGLENSVTVGVISGRDRAFSSSQCEYSCSGLLQTDASINPGNSGGALLNLDGHLVGINLAVVQNAQNIGFAVPVDKVRRLLDDFHKNKATP